MIMMTSINLLPPVAEILGWTILHSLWQGALIALLVELIRRHLPVRASQARYLLAFSALNLLMVLAVATFLYLNGQDTAYASTTLPTLDAQADLLHEGGVIQNKPLAAHDNSSGIFHSGGADDEIGL